MGTKKERARGRFSETLIAKRIEAARISQGLTVAEFCEKVGWGKWDYSRKVTNRQLSLSLADIERIAEGLDMAPLWPFVDEATAQRLHRVP